MKYGLSIIWKTSRNNLELLKGPAAPFGNWQDASKEGLSVRGCHFLRDRKIELWECERELSFWIGARSFSKERVSFFLRNQEGVFFRVWEGLFEGIKKESFESMRRGYHFGSIQSVHFFQRVVDFFFFLSLGCWSIIGLTPRHSWYSSTHLSPH